MDQKSFQRQILSQIGMGDLAEALIQFEKEKANATGLMSYCLGSRVLDNANDATALKMLNMLIDDAKIPNELLDILRHYTALSKSISKDTWEYFYNYTFTGKIETSFTVPNGGMDPSAKPLFLIVAENCIVDILSKPLNMLLGYVEHMATHWKKVKAIGAQTYFLSKHHSELFLFIEAHIADFYGAKNAFEVGVITETFNVFIGYRFVGIIDKVPFNQKFYQIAKQSALQQAANTLTK
jgi:hypothetical protein